jgi:hypothetical protein
LYQVGTIGSNQVLQYHYPGPSYHFPLVTKIYRQKFSHIDEVGVTFYLTQDYMGWSRLFMGYDDNLDNCFLNASYDNRLALYEAGVRVAWIDLWSDVHIMDVSHRMEMTRVDGTLVGSVTRLDTNETKSLSVDGSSCVGELVGFGAYGDHPGGTYINLDDFYVRGTPLVVNEPPDCTEASPSVDTLWPPNHSFVAVDVLGVIDPDGDEVAITIDSIFQDEPVDGQGDGSFTPDGQGVGTATAEVRAERAGPGNGRVYHIGFTADDGHGGTCSGEVLVGVPKNQGKKGAPVDDGPLYDSTALAP